MKVLLKLLRIKQWIKNIFILLPAFFGGTLSLIVVNELIIGFFSFSFIASSIYIINDLSDIEADKQHPKKKNRPIPAGLISKPKAISISIALFITSISLSFFFLSTSFILVLFAYYLLNLAYSTVLKHISLLDIAIVSFGFVFRIIAGGELVNVEISFWLLLMTFLFSLFIVIAKRRDDFNVHSSASQIRKVNQYYNLAFLNTILSMVASLMMVCYIMYTTSSIYFIDQPYWALASCILVIIGLIRYFQAIYVEENGGSPTEFAIKDNVIKVIVFSWLSIFCYLIYF